MAAMRGTFGRPASWGAPTISRRQAKRDLDTLNAYVDKPHSKGK